MITSCLSISPSEEQRLRAMEQYPFDFDQEEKQFDEITEMAAAICNMPIAYISIVELDKQRFKSKVGFEMKESMRDVSFCQYTIQSDSILEIPDTHKHPLFSNNPLVVNEPRIRFYAGAPLINSDGIKLGSLCVVDKKPGKLTLKQRKMLEQLADITVSLFELKRRERDLQQAKQHADDLTRAKGNFLSTMSHEIRTPLNGILGISSILMQDNPGAHQRQYLETLRFSAHNLMAIVNDILDFSKIDAGRIRLESIPFNLYELLNNIRTSHLPRVDEKKIKLEFMPDPALPRNIIGDPVRLTQILNNLVANAVKFTEEGSVTIAAYPKSEADNRVTIGFSVADTGIGIPEEQQKIIFDRFSQGDGSITRKFGGTGLGLAITSRLLELLGSSIQLNSQPGAGSRFAFELSFDIADANVQITPPATTQQKPLGQHRILLAEDNQVNIMIAQKVMQPWGITLDVALNGQDAVRLVQDNNYELVLMDLEMPVMSGFEATREIRLLGNRFTTLPILAMSASVMDDTLAEALQSGMNGFILKPFDPAELYEKVRTLLTHTPPVARTA